MERVHNLKSFNFNFNFELRAAARRRRRRPQPHRQRLALPQRLRLRLRPPPPLLMTSMGAAASTASSLSSACGGAPASPLIPAGAQLATLAAGCFWCVEAPYSGLKGIFSATSGYIGGHVPHPTYDAVCSGTTGHAEAVRVAFDPAVIPYRTLLDVFFAIHDPTTLNRQGNDVGTQYRSAIFTHGEEQAAAVRAKVAELEASGVAPVTTQVARAEEHTWYPAEEYHQCYVERNPTQGYVRAVSLPKLLKAKKEFAGLFK